ncbi:MAG TPA: hypothetical protein VFK84_03465 [Burkholderiales bacterium]|nr:hypothetical protein [Burkholderiales bacterium]
MATPFDFLIDRVGEIEQLLDAPHPDRLERICAAALQIVLRAPSGDISKVASTVATSARLCLEDPSKAQMYERPLRGAVRNLRRALEVEAPD